jgi:hypothetical protein
MSTLYKDGLVEITDQEIVFHRYYFPFGGDKRVLISDIDSVEVRPPSFWGGSWRIWGSGNFRSWFPLDGARPSRDRLFFTNLRGGFRRIGFTVEHSEEAVLVLKAQGLLRCK